MLTLYAAGLRLSEATHLKVKHIDSSRMQLKVEAGKGGKDRYVPLFSETLDRNENLLASFKPTDFLFPGKTPDTPLNGAVIQKCCKLAAAMARITKPVTTSHLEALLRDWPARSRCGSDGYQQAAGTQLLLNYDDLSALSAGTFGQTPSPADWLPPPVPTVDRSHSGQDDQAKSNQAKELPNHQRN